MFTGIIEELGTVAELNSKDPGARLVVRCKAVLSDARAGSSIAVNGVCLTVLLPGENQFEADLSPETLARTNLGQLQPGGLVNLERPLPAAGRFGGHIVQGHVDGVGELASLEALGDGNWRLRVRVPQALDRYIVEKGSIAIDGISLTVAGFSDRVVSAAIIPHTYDHTSLKERRARELLNVEVDILAKYVETLVGRYRAAEALNPSVPP